MFKRFSNSPSRIFLQMRLAALNKRDLLSGTEAKEVGPHFNQKRLED
jgi:hypothetical protein